MDETPTSSILKNYVITSNLSDFQVQKELKQ